MHKKHNRKIIYLAGFLFSIPIALVSYINSSLLENQLGENYVAIVYVLASLVTIGALLKMPKILNRFGNRITAILSSFFIFLSLFLLGNSSSILIIPVFVLYFVSTNFLIASLDIFLEDFSKNSEVGSLRGFYLMIINFAWILAQLISGNIINQSSFSGIYHLASLIMISVCLIFIFCLRNFVDPEYKKVSIKKTLASFRENKNISRIYYSNLLLQFFYAWMVIYTPIYLHEHLGFSWDKIGLIFSVMLIPFVLLDYPLGKLSDKIGEKKMLLTGFSIMILSVLIIPLIKEAVFIFWALILFSTRVGAATVEVMNESYFFKIVKKEDADEISFYRNAPSFSYVIAPLLAFPVLFLIPSLEYLFFILSAILLIGILISSRLKDIK